MARARGAVRVQLAEAAAEDVDLIKQSLRDAMTATKTRAVQCPKCQWRFSAEINDAAAAVRAAEVWLNQGFGSPSLDRKEASEPLELIRILIQPGEVDEYGDLIQEPDDTEPTDGQPVAAPPTHPDTAEDE